MAGGRFKPGQSGNPGGRPKGVGEVRDLARQHTIAAMRGLVKVLKNPKSPPAAIVAAANAILDRAWGKPAQPVDVNASNEFLAALRALGRAP